MTADLEDVTRTQNEHDESTRLTSILKVGVYAERFALPVLLAAIILVFCLLPQTSSVFPTRANLQSLALTQCVVAIAALAVTIPLVAGQFDVSVGPILGMTSILAGKITVTSGGPVWLAIVVGPLAGGCVGVVSGYVVAYIRTNSFIITLGVGTLVGGGVIQITNNQIITGAPQSLVDVGTRTWLGGRLDAPQYALRSTTRSSRVERACGADCRRQGCTDGSAVVCRVRGLSGSSRSLVVRTNRRSQSADRFRVYPPGSCCGVSWCDYD